jgi:multidrug efflux pump subunit AcrA (membrane-fusion protein)
MTRRSLLTSLFALLLLSAAVMVFMALVATKPGATAKPPQERAWTVATSTVTPGPHQPTLRLYGRVESPRTAMLTAAMTADVIEVGIREGEDVILGQSLLLLDPRDLKLELTQRNADVAQLQAQIDSEKTRYQSDQRALQHEQTLLDLNQQARERATTLKKRKLGSDSELDQARQNVARQRLALNTRRQDIDDHPARLAQLQARLQRAIALRDETALQLKRTAVSAPFSGRVAKVMVSPGSRVRGGEELLEVYDTNALEVRAQVPETQVAALRQGLASGQPLLAQATLDGSPLTLQLMRLAGRVDPGRGGIEALFLLQHGELAPRLGRFIDLTLTLPPQQNTIAVSGSALYGTHRVYRINEQQRLQAVEVTRVGSISNADETLLANAVDGLKVKPAERKDTSGE